MTQVRARVTQRYGFLFDVDEESDQSDYEGTIAQGLALLDGSVVATGASLASGGSALAEVLAMPGTDAQKIEALYLRTLSRQPASEEIDQWTRFVQDAGDSPGPRAPATGAKSAGPPDPLRGLEGRRRAAASARALARAPTRTCCGRCSTRANSS